MTSVASQTAKDQLAAAIREAVGRTMAQVGDQEPSIQEADGQTAAEGISAMIDYQGDVAFTLVLAVPRAVVDGLTRTFTGVPISWDADILEDVIGELLNVIGGDVAAELTTRGTGVQMGLPRVERTLDAARAVPGGTLLDEFDVSDKHGCYRLMVVATGEAG